MVCFVPCYPIHELIKHIWMLVALTRAQALLIGALRLCFQATNRVLILSSLSYRKRVYTGARPSVVLFSALC
jgi:hypothetical protein